MLTPLPPYIASNMTDEEFQGLLDRSEVPAYVRERFAEIYRYRAECEEDEEERNKAEEKESAEHLAYESRVEDVIGRLREPWEKLARILHPDNGAVKAMEDAIKAAEEVE